MNEESLKKALTVGLFLFAVVGLFLESHRTISSPLMRSVMSLCLTAASLFVILSKDYGPKDKHWAYATIGTILGFWLRSGGK